MEEKHLPPALKTNNLREHIEQAGLRQNEHPAAFTLTKAFLQDTHYSSIESIKKYCSKSDQRLIFKTLQKLLESNLKPIKTAAQKSLGDCFYYRFGMGLDLKQAVAWYQKAANQGNASAQCRLGYLYQQGIGVSRDQSRAVYWYRKATEPGHAGSQYWLAHCYAHGYGVQEDPAQAAQWYRKAAEQGNVFAKGCLKYLVRHGTKWPDPEVADLAMLMLGSLEKQDISEAKLANRLGQVLSKCPSRESWQEHVNHFITTQAVMNNLIHHNLTGSPTRLSLLQSQDSRQAFLKQLEPGRLLFEGLTSIQKGLVQIFLLSGPNSVVSNLASQKIILGPSLDVSHIQVCCEFLIQQHQEHIDGLDDKTAPLPQYKATFDALEHVLNLACHVTWDKQTPWNLRNQNVKLIKCVHDINLFSGLIGFEHLNARCSELLKDKLLKPKRKLGCSIM